MVVGNRYRGGFITLRWWIKPEEVLVKPTSCAEDVGGYRSWGYWCEPAHGAAKTCLWRRERGATGYLGGREATGHYCPKLFAALVGHGYAIALG